MKALVISNMYPGPGSSFGIFVHRQVVDMEKQGVRVQKIVKTENSKYAYVQFVLKILYDLLIKRSSYDVIHAHYGFHSAFIPAIVKRSPLVLTYHGSDALREPFRQKLYSLLQKFVVKRADRIIAVSREVKATIVSRLGGDENRIEVISCGVDSTVFVPQDKIRTRKLLGIAPDTKIVLFVGKLEFMKGVDIIYDCARRRPRIDFYLAGEGRLRSELPNCHFLDHVPNDRLPQWLNAADVFVLPSRSEGTPVVILEAFACGTPVVASDVGGIPDLMSGEKTGFLLPMKAMLKNGRQASGGKTDIVYTHAVVNAMSQIMAERIGAILDSEHTQKQMGTNARHLAETTYDNRLIASRIRDVYQRLCY